MVEDGGTHVFRVAPGVAGSQASEAGPEFLAYRKAEREIFGAGFQDLLARVTHRARIAGEHRVDDGAAVVGAVCQQHLNDAEVAAVCRLGGNRAGWFVLSVAITSSAVGRGPSSLVTVPTGTICWSK